MNEEQYHLQRRYIREYSYDDRIHENEMAINLIEKGFPETTLVIKGYEHDENLPLEEFYKKLFDLLYIHGSESSDRNIEKYEYCSSRKSRSLIDQFRICKHYYDCSLITFLKMLATINKDEDVIVGYYCPDIKRCVIGPASKNLYASWARSLNVPAEELGFRTFKQLLNLLYDENNKPISSIWDS